jgi:hypothetical protein
MSQQDGVRHIWRITLPQEAYSHQFIMHGLLSLAALHKASLLPVRRQEYLAYAAHHHNIGQEKFRVLILDIDHRNARPIFCFALIIVGYVCLRPISSDYTQSATVISWILELFSVTRGIKAALMPFLDALINTDLAALRYSVWATNLTSPSQWCVNYFCINGPLLRTLTFPSSTHSLRQTCLPHDIFHALARLTTFFQLEPTLSNEADYREAIAALEQSALHIAHAGTYPEVGAVLLWPFLIPESVMADLRQWKPGALVLLAYYAATFGALDGCYWFFQGKPRQLVHDIVAHLEGQDRLVGVLAWPSRNV